MDSDPVDDEVCFAWPGLAACALVCLWRPASESRMSTCAFPTGRFILPDLRATARWPRGFRAPCKPPPLAPLPRREGNNNQKWNGWGRRPPIPFLMTWAGMGDACWKPACQRKATRSRSCIRGEGAHSHTCGSLAHNGRWADAHRACRILAVRPSGQRGREKQMRAPTVVLGSAHMRPPWASTIARARYRPRPAPLVCLTALEDR